MDLITDTDVEDIQPAQQQQPPLTEPPSTPTMTGKPTVEEDEEEPQERIHAGLRHVKKKKKKDGFIPLEDSEDDEDSEEEEDSEGEEDSEDEEDGASCPLFFAPFSPYKKPKEEIFERDVEKQDPAQSQEQEDSEKKKEQKKKSRKRRRRRRRRCHMPDPCCCVKAIIRNWKKIESTPLRYLVLLGISIASIALAFLILSIVVKSLTAVWIFTKWYTGSAAEATFALIVCALFGAFILVASCFSMYVPSCREGCCGPEISNHCGLDYRDDCCGCMIHFCQHYLDMD